VLTRPGQGGADGLVLWLLEKRFPGERQKEQTDDLIPCIIEADRSSKEQQKKLNCLDVQAHFSYTSTIQKQVFIKKPIFGGALGRQNQLFV
jgi:hypothetical protein